MDEQEGGTMKITIAAPRYPPATGGAEKYIEYVATGLCEMGHRVKVLTTDYEQHLCFKRFPPDVPKKEERNGVRVFRCFSVPVRRYGYFITPSMMVELLLDSPDIVYASGFGYWPALAATVAGRITRKKVILQPNFSVSSAPFNRAYRRWLGPILRRADGAVFYSDYERKLMASEGPIPRRFIVAPPGVAPAFFEEAPPRGVMARYGLGGGPVVLSVGRVDKFKRLDVVIRAAPLLIRSIPDVAFMFVGPDFGDRKRLETLAGKLGVGDQVVFTGRLNEEDLLSAYREAAALAHPSGFELFGMVLAEAFAAGLPVVAARVGSIPDIVHHEQTGLLVDFCDVEATADALARVLTDKVLRASLIEAAQKKAHQNFRWKTTVENIERLCREVLD